MLIKRKKSGKTGSSIAKRIIADLTGITQRKVVDLNEIRNGKKIAEDLEKTILSQAAMSRLDPVHAVYVYAQNKLSVLVEQLAPLPAVAKLSNVCADADEEYMPSGPPMSPLTQSYSQRPIRLGSFPVIFTVVRAMRRNGWPFLTGPLKKPDNRIKAWPTNSS